MSARKLTELPANVVRLRPNVVVKQRPKRPKRAGSGLGKPALRAVTAPATLPAAWTSRSGENDSPSSTLQVLTSPIPVRVSPGLSTSPAKAKRSVRTEFEQQVRALKPMQLRERFPGEAACHKGMLGRRRDGYVVHESLVLFRDFLLCLGPMLTPGLSIDRKDPEDREYAPGKIRWATARQQANNRATTVFLELRGERRSLSDWARLTGQKRNTIWRRHNRGCSDEEAVYGRNEHAPEPKAEPVETEGYIWPGSQPDKWEHGFLGFLAVAKRHPYLRLYPARAFTRDVFLAWVAGNVLTETRRVLRQRYPGFDEPDGDPDYQNPTEALADPDHRYIDVLAQPHDQAMRRVRSDKAAYDLWLHTLRKFPAVRTLRQDWAHVFRDLVPAKPCL